MGTLDALGERLDAGAETDDAETRKAYGTFRSARAALRTSVAEAAESAADGTQITADAKWERFAKADKLQSDGKLPRAQARRRPAATFLIGRPRALGASQACPSQRGVPPFGCTRRCCASARASSRS